MRKFGMLATVVVAGVVMSIAHADTSDDNYVYTETISIEADVDDNRYVEEAVVRNTVEGDHLIEFTAEIEEEGVSTVTRERWTVFHRHTGDEHVLSLDIGTSFMFEFVVSNLDHPDPTSVTLTTPTDVETVTLPDEPSDDAAYMVLFAGIADEFDVVTTIVDDVKGHYDAQFQPSQNVVDFCESYCDSLHPEPPQCDQPGAYAQYVCCRWGAHWSYCFNMCICDQTNPTALCRANAAAALTGDLAHCIGEYVTPW